MSMSGIWGGFDDYNTTGERWDSVTGTLAYGKCHFQWLRLF